MSENYEPGTRKEVVTLTYQIQMKSQDRDYWMVTWTSPAVVEGSVKAAALLVDVHKRLDRAYNPVLGYIHRAVCKRWTNIQECESVPAMWAEV